MMRLAAIDEVITSLLRVQVVIPSYRNEPALAGRCDSRSHDSKPEARHPISFSVS